MAQPEVELNNDGILLTMRGHLTAEESEPSIEKLHGLIPEGSFVVTVILDEMTSYEPEARRVWTEALRPYRGRISSLRLVGIESSIVRMAGAAVGMALGIRVEFVDE